MPALPSKSTTMKKPKSMKGVTRGESGGKKLPRPVSKRVDVDTSSRIVRAEAEDAADAAWLAECQNIEHGVESEYPGLPWYEVTGIACKRFPPQPAGFRERRTQCNRCGQELERHPDYDAQFCRPCNRWTEAKCPDPRCAHCSRRPERPLP